MKAQTQKFKFESRADFRAWLTDNAGINEGVWLVFGKTQAVPTLSAAEALEEALCFGWIDGLIKSVDENAYLKYFKERSKTSNWSEKNQNLADKLEKQGLMTDRGREKIEYVKKNGHWNANKNPPSFPEDLILRFCEKVRPFEPAYTNLMKMSPSVRKNYAASYFYGAKTDEGRQKRFKTIIERLNLNLDNMQSMKKALEDLKDQ